MGKAEAIGCSDGQREGFANLLRFPNIAGCLGAWQGRKKLNAERVSGVCGDDAGACASPADLCASGWHVCARDGNNQDLKDRVSSADCESQAGPGRFVAAMSHGQSPRICPPPPGPHTRFPCTERGVCSEPVCCGDACSFGACRDAVWRGKTRISRASPNGCGSALSKFHGGVLCCRDNIIKSLDPSDVQGDLGAGLPPRPPAKAASSAASTAPEKKTPAPAKAGAAAKGAPSKASAPARKTPPPVKPSPKPAKTPVAKKN